MIKAHKINIILSVSNKSSARWISRNLVAERYIKYRMEFISKWKHIPSWHDGQMVTVMVGDKVFSEEDLHVGD